MTHNYLF